MRYKKMTRLLSTLLCCSMLLTILPTYAFAAGSTENTPQTAAPEEMSGSVSLLDTETEQTIAWGETYLYLMTDSGKPIDLYPGCDPVVPGEKGDTQIFAESAWYDENKEAVKGEVSYLWFYTLADCGKGASLCDLTPLGMTGEYWFGELCGYGKLVEGDPADVNSYQSILSGVSDKMWQYSAYMPPVTAEDIENYKEGATVNFFAVARIVTEDKQIAYSMSPYAAPVAFSVAVPELLVVREYIPNPVYSTTSPADTSYSAEYVISYGKAEIAYQWYTAEAEEAAAAHEGTAVADAAGSTFELARPEDGAEQYWYYCAATYTDAGGISQTVYSKTGCVSQVNCSAVPFHLAAGTLYMDNPWIYSTERIEYQYGSPKDGGSLPRYSDFPSANSASGSVRLENVYQALGSPATVSALLETFFTAGQYLTYRWYRHDTADFDAASAEPVSAEMTLTGLDAYADRYLGQMNQALNIHLECPADGAGEYFLTMVVTNHETNGEAESTCDSYATMHIVTKETTGGLYLYEKVDDEIHILGYRGCDRNPVVPAAIDGCPVTEITNFGRDGTESVYSVTLPDAVRVIGYAAFFGIKSLKTLKHYDSDPSTAAAGLPRNLGRIEMNAFSLEYAGTGNRVDYGLEMALELPQSLTYIGENAFINTGITRLTFHPDVAPEIGNYAFRYCDSLNVVVMPANTTIDLTGDETFRDCSTLSSVVYYENILEPDWLNDFYATPVYPQLINGRLTDGEFNYALSQDGEYYILAQVVETHPTSLTFPDTFNGKPVKQIGGVSTSMGSGSSPMAYGFIYDASALESITISKGIEIVTNRTFDRFPALKTVTLEEGSALSVIEERAFSECKALESFNFSAAASLREIGVDAFSYCNALASPVVLPDEAVVYYDAFYACYSLPSLTMGADCRLYNDSFSFCLSLEEVCGTDAKGNSWSTADGWVQKSPLDPDLPWIADVDYCDALSSVYSWEHTNFYGSPAFNGGYFNYYIRAMYDESPIALEPQIALFGDDPRAWPNASHIEWSYHLAPGYIYSLTDDGKVNIDYSTDFGAERIEFPATLSGRAVDGVSSFALDLVRTTDVASQPDIALSFAEGVRCIYDEGTDSTYSIRRSGSACVFLTPPDDDYWLDDAWGMECVDQLTLPTTMESIAIRTFAGNKRFTQVTLPAALTEMPLFSNCTALESLTFASGSLITEIGGLSGCTSLASITLPSRATTIEYGTFKGCTALETVAFEDNISALTRITEDAFKDCTALKSFSLPLSLRSIGMSAFENCTSLTSLTWQTVPGPGVELGEDGLPLLTNIEKYAFSGCTALSSFPFPASLLEMGEYCFKGSGLTSIDLTEVPVSTLPVGAFYGCSRLSSVTLGPNQKTLGEATSSVTYDGVFQGCAIHELHLSEGLLVIGACTFKNGFAKNELGEIARVSLPDSVTTISVHAFYCDKEAERTFDLVDGKLPASLTSIGSSAFYGPNVTKLVFPESLTEIGNGACSGMSALTGVVFHDGITAIGEQAFLDCYNLTAEDKHLILPAGLKTIGRIAFVATADLQSFTVPAGIESISEYAFSAIYDNSAEDPDEWTQYPCTITILAADANKPVLPETSLIYSSGKVLIRCYANSAAHTWAKAKKDAGTENFDYELLDANGMRLYVRTGESGYAGESDITSTVWTDAGSGEQVGTGPVLYEYTVGKEYRCTVTFSDEFLLRYDVPRTITFVRTAVAEGGAVSYEVSPRPEITYTGKLNTEGILSSDLAEMEFAFTLKVGGKEYSYPVTLNADNTFSCAVPRGVTNLSIYVPGYLEHYQMNVQTLADAELNAALGELTLEKNPTAQSFDLVITNGNGEVISLYDYSEKDELLADCFTLKNETTGEVITDAVFTKPLYQTIWHVMLGAEGQRRIGPEDTLRIIYTPDPENEVYFTCDQPMTFAASEITSNTIVPVRIPVTTYGRITFEASKFADTYVFDTDGNLVGRSIDSRSGTFFVPENGSYTVLSLPHTNLLPVLSSKASLDEFGIDPSNYVSRSIDVEKNKTYPVYPSVPETFTWYPDSPFRYSVSAEQSGALGDYVLVSFSYRFDDSLTSTDRQLQFTARDTLSTMGTLFVDFDGTVCFDSDGKKLDHTVSGNTLTLPLSGDSGTINFYTMPYGHYFDVTYSQRFEGTTERFTIAQAAVPANLVTVNALPSMMAVTEGRLGFYAYLPENQRGQILIDGELYGSTFRVKRGYNSVPFELPPSYGTPASHTVALLISDYGGAEVYCSEAQELFLLTSAPPSPVSLTIHLDNPNLVSPNGYPSERYRKTVLSLTGGPNSGDLFVYSALNAIDKDGTFKYDITLQLAMEVMNPELVEENSLYLLFYRKGSTEGERVDLKWNAETETFDGTYILSEKDTTPENLPERFEYYYTCADLDLLPVQMTGDYWEAARAATQADIQAHQDIIDAFYETYEEPLGVERASEILELILNSTENAALPEGQRLTREDVGLLLLQQAYYEALYNVFDTSDAAFAESLGLGGMTDPDEIYAAASALFGIGLGCEEITGVSLEPLKSKSMMTVSYADGKTMYQVVESGALYVYILDGSGSGLLYRTPLPRTGASLLSADSDQVTLFASDDGSLEQLRGYLQELQSKVVDLIMQVGSFINDFALDPKLEEAYTAYTKSLDKIDELQAKLKGAPELMEILESGGVTASNGERIYLEAGEVQRALAVRMEVASLEGELKVAQEQSKKLLSNLSNKGHLGIKNASRIIDGIGKVTAPLTLLFDLIDLKESLDDCAARCDNIAWERGYAQSRLDAVPADCDNRPKCEEAVEDLLIDLDDMERTLLSRVCAQGVEVLEGVVSGIVSFAGGAAVAEYTLAADVFTWSAGRVWELGTLISELVNMNQTDDDWDNINSYCYRCKDDDNSGSGGGSNNNNNNNNNGRPKGGGGLRMPVLRDPAGYVYEAVTSNRVEGATARAYYMDESGNEVFWADADYYNEVNPQTTDEYGEYAWMTPAGSWRVRVTKDGYQDGDSLSDPEANAAGWLPVPPPQMAVNIPLVSKAAPTVSETAAAPNVIKVRFSQYMDISQLQSEPGLVTVTQNGSPVSVRFTFDDAEASPTAPGVYYGRELSITREDGGVFAGTVTLNISAALKNYTGTSFTAPYSAALDVKPIVGSLVHSYQNQFGMSVGEDSQIVLLALDTQGDPISGVTVSVQSVVGDSLKLESTSAVSDENGRAVFNVRGRSSGTDVLTFSAGIGVTTRMNTSVANIATNAPAKPTADLSDWQTVSAGTQLTITAGPGVTIYYTTDDTCPCTEGEGRKVYTGPITITGSGFYRIAAYTEEGGYSERLNLHIIVEGNAGITSIAASRSTGTVNYSIVNAPSTGTAYVMIAQYQGQQTTEVWMSEAINFAVAPVLAGNCGNAFTDAAGCTYKVFLLDGSTYAPLCSAVELS